MRFEVLGPVRVVVHEQVRERFSDLRRRLLAVLLANRNRMVSTDSLVETIWRKHRPKNPTKSLHVHVHRLRQLLDTPDRLASTSSGYLLTVGADELDSEIFDRLHARARAAVRRGDVETGIQDLRAALAWWRSDPYADVEEPGMVAAEARRLAEARLLALEELYDAELAVGASRELVPELTERVAEYPLRERFAGQLMRALNRSGRRTRAMATYRSLRRRMSQQLGAEPGHELQRLYASIRSGDTDRSDESGSPEDAENSDRPGSSPVSTTASGAGHEASDRPAPPVSLPPAPAGFFGRTNELRELVSAGVDGGTAELVVITGMAGIGKTGLALQAAHQVTDRFDGGSLYVDLRGHSERPALQPLEALGILLRAIDPEVRALPSTVEEASGLFRSKLTGTRTLVLLDNAASADQVRPLLPSASGCVTLVTSRNRLTGLVAREGARRIGLDALSVEVSEALLIRLLGEQRVAEEPEAVAELADRCAGLPLALRIAGAQLADQPRCPISEYVQELAIRGSEALALDDDESEAVAPAFELSYVRLDPEAQRLFRLLGLVPGPDFTEPVAAALLETSSATRPLRALIGAHLLQEHAKGRFRFHDLLRDYARSRAEVTQSPGSRRAAEGRLFTYYYRSKERAVQRLRADRRDPPRPELADGIVGRQFDVGNEASSWIRAEFANLAAISQAELLADRGDRAAHLLLGLGVYGARHGLLNDALAAMEPVIDVLRSGRERRLLAHLLTEYGAARVFARLPLEPDLLAEARSHAEAVDDRGILAYCLYASSVALINDGEGEQAVELLEYARVLERERGDSGGEATMFAYLGVNAWLRGELRRAESYYWMAYSELPDSPVTSSITTNFCFVRLLLGRRDGIEELLNRSKVLAERTGDRSAISVNLICRSEWALALGNADEALELSLQSKRYADEIGLPRQRSYAEIAVGFARLAIGDLDGAHTAFTTAFDQAVLGALPEEASNALRGLAECALEDDDPVEAISLADRAIDEARESQQIQIAEATCVLARAELAVGRHADAIAHARAALAGQREAEHWLGQARAHRVLGEALVAVGDEAGMDELAAALEMFEQFGSPDAAEVAELLRERSSAVRAEAGS